jgi:hypothetical protein
MDQMKSGQPLQFAAFSLGGICLAGVIAVAGRALPARPESPSPWFIQDGGQYFPPGPEFKLSREAAAMKAYKADLEAQRAGQ